MGDIDILLYNYCEAIITIIMIIIAVSSYIYTENYLQMCLNTVKVVMISANYHNITRILHDYCLS